MSETVEDRSRRQVSDDRSRKRSKLIDGATTTRTRGFTACENCRLRKTRCNNARPTCGHCERLDRNCIYPDDLETSPCQEIGERVLDAIGKLTDLVKSQDCRQIAQTWNRSTTDYTHIQPQISASSQDTTAWTTVTTGDVVDNDIAQRFSEPALLSAQGTDSVLRWSVFATPAHLSLEHSDKIDELACPVPSFSKAEMLRLSERYVKGVHSMNPVLDLLEVHDTISHIAENGPDWTTRTCLMALICAIGAANQLYAYEGDPPSVRLVQGFLHAPNNHEANKSLSMQYWGVAVKRLGVAMIRNDIQAVQCLSLAGIFCMHLLKPVQAWKYFSLAGAAWHALRLVKKRDDYDESPNVIRSFSIMQSLYFTIWKSEGELALEIDVPGPILDRIKFNQTFPTPPEAESDVADEDNEHQRTWLYYLAEIAVRHLINRVLRTYHEFNFTQVPSTREVRDMLAHARAMKTQLINWHSSLPVIFRFDISDGIIMLPYDDKLTSILQARFLTCSDLLSRPFVRLCVETSLQLEETIRSQVVQLASENIQICISRLSQVSPHVHQGTWFELRSFTTAASVLHAVNLARQYSWLPAAQEIFLPLDWQERVDSARDVLHHLSALDENYVADIFKILQLLQTESGQS